MKESVITTISKGFITAFLSLVAMLVTVVFYTLTSHGNDKKESIKTLSSITLQSDISFSNSHYDRIDYKDFVYGK